MKTNDASLLRILEDAVEKKKQEDLIRLYNKFIEIIKAENPSPYYLLFILELIHWSILKEIIERANKQD